MAKKQTITDTETFIPPGVGKKDKVRFLFQNLEHQGPKGSDIPGLEFTFNGTRYKLKHGRVEELPLEVFEHLRENCNTPIYETIEEDGQQISRPAGFTPRFGLQLVFDKAAAA